MSRDSPSQSQDNVEAVGSNSGTGKYLVEDGAPWFTSLMESAIKNNDVKSDADKIAISFHAFMLELGFVNSVNPDLSSKLPENWRSPSGYVTKYKFLPNSDASIALNVISLGKLLKVHGTNISTKETFSSSSFNPSLFIRKEDRNLTNIGRLARL